MIIIHHLENSRSQRILWLLEELNAPYDLKKYERDPKTSLAPTSLKKIHPLGKSPVIEDAGSVISESANIAEYILYKYDQENKLHPKKEASNYFDYNFWMHFSEGSMMAPLLMALIMGKIKSAKMPFFVKPIANKIVGSVYKGYLGNQLETLFSFVEDHLSQNRWFLGNEFSAADIIMSFPLETGLSGRIDKNKYPSVNNFVQKIKERPAYRKALEAGGEYIY